VIWVNEESGGVLKRWLRRILKGLGILVGVLVVLIIGLALYVQLTWDSPVSRTVPQTAVATDAQTVARDEPLTGQETHDVLLALP